MIVDLSDCLPRSPFSLAETSCSSSGLASKTKIRTADVTRPSTRPMARWIGSIRAQKAPKGSSVMPESVVSSTTEKAPSSSVTVQPRTEARMIRARTAAFSPSLENRPLRMIGRQIR